MTRKEKKANLISDIESAIVAVNRTALNLKQAQNENDEAERKLQRLMWQLKNNK